MRPAVGGATITLLSVLAATFHLSCQAATREIPLAMLEGVERPDARQIADYATAVDAIIRVLVQKFELPVPGHMLEIYSTREEYEAGLIKHLGLKPALARSTARFSQAAVGVRKVLVNEPAVADLSWPQRIELLAHEIVHTVQSELAGHRPLNRQQWLTEGFAEWMAFRVTDALGLDDMGRARTRMTAQLREIRRGGALPRLPELDSFGQWVAARSKHGFAATFSLSFLIVEFLIERHSFQAVLDYFRRFRTSGDYVANFSSAFGESLHDFEGALDRHLAQLLD